METKLLFGGAIECRLPIGSIDLSDIRPVPSHQECWFLETDQPALSSVAFLIELFQQQQQHDNDTDTDNVADEKITEFLFRDFAEANGAVESQCSKSFPVELPSLLSSASTTSNPITSVGNIGRCIGQRASGTMTTALPNSSSAAPEEKIFHVEISVIRLPQQTTDILLTIMVPLRLHNQCTAQARLWMDEMIASFRVRDWGLFDP